MNPISETIAYRDARTPLTGVLARPDRPSTDRGIVLVHGGAGLDQHAREQAVRYAGLGYPVFACDMFGDGVAGDRAAVMGAIGALRADRALVRARVEAARGVLRDAGANGAHAIVGFCFGGLVALETARDGADLAAAISVHGTLSTSRPAGPGDVRAEVLVCHGARDPHVPAEQVGAFMAEMTDARAVWQLNVYGDAMHGFTHRTATTPANGVAYDATADARSFAACAQFLGAAFETGPAGA